MLGVVWLLCILPVRLRLVLARMVLTRADDIRGIGSCVRTIQLE